MASTLVMSVAWNLFPSDCFYLYCVDFGDVRSSKPTMVRFFVSSIKYIHGRQCDEARGQAETDRSVKEKIANDNANKFFLITSICSSSLTLCLVHHDELLLLLLLLLFPVSSTILLIDRVDDDDESRSGNK